MKFSSYTQIPVKSIASICVYILLSGEAYVYKLKGTFCAWKELIQYVEENSTT